MGARRGSAFRWLIAIVTAIFVFGGVSPASAHDTLVSSNPADEEVLDASPAEVVLTFSAEVMQVGGAITLVDADDDPVAAGELTYDGTDVVLPVEDELAPGGHAVRWRVVSSDGHPISGAFTFSHGSDGPPPPALDASGTSGDDTVDDADTNEDAAAAQDGDTGSTGGGTRILVIAGAGAVLGILVFLLGTRVASRRTTSS